MNQQKLKQNNQKVCIQHGRRQSMIRDFRGSQATVKRATCTLLLRGMLIAAIALIVPGSVLVALFAPQTAQAQTPNTTVNFQARILTSTGAIVPDGNYHIEFKLYDSVGSGASAQGVCSLNSSTDDCWWLETRSTGNLVRVVNGYISVNLGSVTAFGSSIPWSQDLYVTMRVGGTSGPSWDNEMTNGGNRMKLNVAPLALVSNNVRTANRTSTASDNITIQTGNTTTSGNSGNVAIDVGTAAGTAGTISLGSANASALSLGRTGITTTNAGALTVTQLATLNGGLTVEAGDNFTFGSDVFTDFVGGGLINSAGVLSIDTTTATGAFINGGNAFTANATLGINANYDLNVETNSLTRLTVQADGDVAVDTDTLFVNATDNNVVIGGTTRTANESLTVITADGRSGIVHTNGTVAVGTAIGFNQAYFGTDTNHALLLYANGVDSFGINTSNTVFVGSTATGATLASGLGDLLVQGNLEVKDKTLVTGAVTDAVEGSLLLVTGTSTSTTNNQYGASLEIVAAPASASIRHFAGASIYASTTSANLTGGTLTGSYNGAINDGTGTVNKVQGIVIETGNGSTGTINLLKGINVWTPNNVSGTITNAYGISIDDQTAGTNDYGLAIEGADTYAFWLGSGADNTDAANGITFGLSGDTNLYRSAANTLRTDDSLSVGGTLAVTGNTTLTGDLAVNGNDITTGAGDLTITPAGGDTIVTGTLTVTTSATVNGLLTGTLGATISGATANINASSNFATNINTGTSTGAVSIGNSLAGVTTIQGAASATALQVLDATSASLFTVDTSARSGSGGNLLKVGNSTGTDTATTILQLDSATAVPTTNLSALNGGLFYNSTTNKVSIIENGVVKVVCNATDASCGGNSTTLQQSYDADADGSDATIALTSTDGSIILSNPSSGGSTSAYILNINQLATGAVGGLDVQSAGTGNLFRVRDTTATAADVLTIADGGASTFKNQTNSTSAFQIQNAAGSSLFNLDTTNSRITLATDLETTGTINSPYGGTGVIGNLIGQSEEFDNGYVYATPTNITVTANPNDAVSNPAPDGKTTADKLTSTSAGGFLAYEHSSIATAGTYTYSVWLKTNSGSQPVTIRLDSTAGTPTTGTVANITATTAWKRYSVTQTFTGSPTEIFPVITITNSGVDVVAWGAQVQTGTSMGVYTPSGNYSAQEAGTVVNGLLRVYGDGFYDGIIFGAGDSNASTALSKSRLTVPGYVGNFSFNNDTTDGLFNFQSGGSTALSVKPSAYNTGTGTLIAGSSPNAVTQTAAVTGLSLDQSTNFTVPNSAAGNQTGINLTVKNGGASATATGISIQGTADTGINFGGTITTDITTTAARILNITTGTTGGLTLDTGTTGAINIGTNANAKTITLGNATGATSIVLNAGTGPIDIGANAIARSINVGTGAAVVQTISIGGTGANVIALGNTQTGGSLSAGSAMTGGTISFGGIAQTGTITLGAATTATSQAINISSANGTASTQTITIGGGTSTTSGGKVVNIATGIPGASTTNTVAIGNGGTTTGTVGVTIGSVGGAAHTTLLQGGNGATALRLVTASGGTLSVGNNGVASTIQVGNTTGAFTQTINIGNNATASSTTNIVIGSTIAGTTSLQGTLTIGSATTETVTFNSTVLANNASTGSSINTSGTGTNTGTVTLASSGFANGDIIFIDNVGQDYYTRVTAGGGTASLTVDPVVTFEATRPVIKYNVQNLGAVNTGTTFANANRFFQGYFLGGVVTGAGSTTLSDGNLVSTNSLNIRASGNLTVGASDTTATQLVVDTKTSAGDPTGVNGGIYYNSSSSKFRCFQASAWADCVATSSGANTTLSNLGTTAINASLLFDSDDTYNIGADATRLHDLYSAGTIRLGTSSANDATISQQAGGLTFIATTTTANFVFGSSDTFGQLVVLDTKTGSGDPTCVNGGMYYNSNSASFRVCKNSVWVTLVAGVDIQNFTANGNWTRPSGTTVVMVVMCGGGGSGGGGISNAGGGGGTGGGGGSYVERTFSASDTVAVGATVAVTVGASSTGGTVGNNGNVGNQSSFGALVVAAGGGAGVVGPVGGGSRSGGGGAGLVTAGAIGGATDSNGGENSSAGTAGIGWSGGGGVTNAVGSSAQMGGGAGGGATWNAIGRAGGGSIYGGGGGGGGGALGGGGPYAGGAGGGTGIYTSGGGGAGGAVDTAGTAGSAGNSTHCGTGGGGGGARSSSAGVGGAGGSAGGGGGGGGAGTVAAAGGAGGRGEVWVYSW